MLLLRTSGLRDGNRHDRSTAGVIDTRYDWDTAGGLPELAAERTAAGSVTRRWVQGPTGPAWMSVPTGQFSDATNYYYHRDHLGSVTDLTTATGSSVATYTYEPFGQKIGVDPVGAPQNPMRFTGEYLDAETQDYHLRARQYDPSTGRFGATDPVTPSMAEQWVSPYAYVGNMPGVYTDPSGMIWNPVRKIYDHYYDAASDGVDPDTHTGNIITLMRAGEDTVDQTLGTGGRALGRGVAQLTDGDIGGALASLGIAGFEIGPGGKARLLGNRILAACRKALGRGAKPAKGGERLVARAKLRAADETGSFDPTARRFTPDQDALVQLAKDAKRRGGLTPEEGSILKGWADELDLPARGPEAHPGRGFGSVSQYHVGPISHIPGR